MSNPNYEFNCYSLLDLEPTATSEEIRIALRKASMKHHPDLGGSHDAMVRLNIAREILCDPQKKEHHDEYWAERNPRPTPKRHSTANRAPGSSPRARTGRAATGRGARSEQGAKPEEPVKPKQGPDDSQNAKPARDALGRLTKRVTEEVETARGALWASLTSRIQDKERELAGRLAEVQKTTVFMSLGILPLGAVAIVLPILWIPAIFLVVTVVSRLVSGVDIRGTTLSLFAGRKAILRKASDVANEACTIESNGLGRYISAVDALSSILRRNSPLSEDVGQLRSRLAVAFFLMGYLPDLSISQTEGFVVTDGLNRIFIKMRLGGSAAVSITHLRKLVETMRILGASRAYFISATGLSPNASAFARKHQVKTFDLNEVNVWIRQVLESEMAGPSRDLLASLDHLTKFISTPTRTQPKGRSYRQGYRRRRYSW